MPEPRRRQIGRARRGTVREINRRIVLNLIRSEQPISRAELARRMQVPRGMITLLIDDLLRDGVVWEGATANTTRGRKPTLLHIRTHDRYALSIDIRFDHTYLTLTDLDSRQLALEMFPTTLDPEQLVNELVRRIQRFLVTNDVTKCEGISVIVPGMVDRRNGVVLNSPQLGWRDVHIRDALETATGLRVFIENAPIACALGHLWLSSHELTHSDNFAYVGISDGVGVGLIANGEVVRGYGDSAGEFGHLPLDVNGVQCLCGLRGCWEAYTSNHATLCRYFNLDPAQLESRVTLRQSGFSVSDLIALAEGGDVRALAALHETAYYLGLGLANIVTAFNPARIIVGGEIIGAWHIVGDVVEAAARGRALTEAARSTPIIPSPSIEHARLRGGVALLFARRLGFSPNSLQRKVG